MGIANVSLFGYLGLGADHFERNRLGQFDRVSIIASLAYHFLTNV